jgi:Abi-like protein
LARFSYADLELTLSLEGVGGYLSWAGGDRARAIDLYTLNTRISESLYTPLQSLEISLRNRIHVVMTEALSDEGWFHQAGVLLNDRQPKQLAKAIEDLKGVNKTPTPGRTVAALSFGFWTAMFGPDYEGLWRTTLHRIAAKPDGTGLRRKDFSGPLTPIRTIRNRIAHHEPIIMWDLRKHHKKMVELTRWLSPAAGAWCRENDRFEQVYPAERISLANIPEDATPSS